MGPQSGLNKHRCLGECRRGAKTRSSPYGNAEVAAGGGTLGIGPAAADEPARLRQTSLQACPRPQRQHGQLQAPAWLPIRLPPLLLLLLLSLPHRRPRRDAAVTDTPRDCCVGRSGISKLAGRASRSRSRVVCVDMSQTAIPHGGCPGDVCLM